MDIVGILSCIPHMLSFRRLLIAGSFSFDTKVPGHLSS
jgi:hypothetical protein